MSLAIRMEAHGGREQAGFFGAGPERLAGTVHLPARQGHAGVVICPSICVDFTRNYRREVELARALASEGVAVLRFHYRGTGNSDGDGPDITFEAMVEDVHTAAAHLRSEAGVDTVALVGTRFGGLVAAAAGLEGPLALIEPVTDPVRFFREGFRARMAHDVREREEARLTTKQLLAELDAEGSVDVLGHSVDRRLFHSAEHHDLAGALGDRPRPVLWLQVSATSPELVKTVDALRARGFAVELAASGGQIAWWFLDDADAGSDELLAAVVPWLLQRLEVG
jgi:pimeloyl-ACP methyl ester carboxylesterase